MRSVRRAAVLPSAFVGRYDPAKAPDPWDELIANSARAVPSERIKASQDGKSLAERSGDLAQAAARRHARHIRALRASRENPSAFAGRYDPATALIEIEEVSPASLARSAAERMAEHVRRQRLARPMPSAFAMPGRSDPVPQSSPALRPALGHNSRGVDIEAEERQEAATAVPTA